MEDRRWRGAIFDPQSSILEISVAERCGGYLPTPPTVKDKTVSSFCLPIPIITDLPALL
jgi:hypothetical protein